MYAAVLIRLGYYHWFKDSRALIPFLVNVSQLLYFNLKLNFVFFHNNDRMF